MALRLRPRNVWESLDLGLALVRNHARVAYSAWFAVYLPAALLVVAIFHDSPFVAYLVLWWLKPLFDRVTLEVLAADLFGDDLRLRDVLRRLPGTLWRSGIVGALTWRRFDLARSLHLPVYQLERLSGKAARSRIRVLDREARGAAVWLTFLLVNIELLLGLGVSLALAFLLPIQTPLDRLFELGFSGRFMTPAGVLAGAAFGALAMSAIEPLYVACGFTLYLQRRTVLEGWDIELRFRYLAARIESLQPAGPTFAALAAVILAVVLSALAPVHPAAAAEPAAREIRNVLADPEFGHRETKSRLAYVGPEWTMKPSESTTDWSWLEEFVRWAVESARALTWGAAALVAGTLLYHLARYFRLRGFERGPRARPDFLFGLDVRPESLPDEIAATAATLARAARIREALSLLYRASLVRFMDEGLEFASGDTEGDCLRRADGAATPKRREYFHRLVNAWRSLAYGHRHVAPDDVVALAVEWSAHFSEPGAPATARGAQLQAAS
jgi:Domain of unknown function (DUF4129)